MTTTLTVTGWTGPSNGVWTDGSNTVKDNIGGVVNPGITANTLSGKDSITGAGGVDTSNAFLTGVAPIYFGVENLGAIIMGKGVNSIAGTAIGRKTSLVYGVYNEADSSISMNGNNNSITGKATGDGSEFPSIFSIAGIYNRSGSIIMDNGNNNSITGIGTATVAVSVNEGTGFLSSGIFNRQGGTIAMGDGNNDSITGTGGYYNGIYNRGTITMGDGNNDTITGTGISDGAYGIYNQNLGSNPTITMGNGNNDSITGIAKGSSSVGIFNETGCTITMGDGNKDSITGLAEGSGSVGIFNKTDGTITMGNGNGAITGTGKVTGIYNDGMIDAGAGNDTVIANGGFAGSGKLLLGEGNDFLKGFGSGSFMGGGGVDTLELTTGTYTVGISGTNTTFTSGSTIMNTTEFEKLIAGATTLNFSSLMNGQTIVV
jgi:hypothetical protein